MRHDATNISGKELVSHLHSAVIYYTTVHLWMSSCNQYLYYSFTICHRVVPASRPGESLWDFWIKWQYGRLYPSPSVSPISIIPPFIHIHSWIIQWVGNGPVSSTVPQRHSLTHNNKRNTFTATESFLLIFHSFLRNLGIMNIVPELRSWTGISRGTFVTAHAGTLFPAVLSQKYANRNEVPEFFLPGIC